MKDRGGVGDDRQARAAYGRHHADLGSGFAGEMPGKVLHALGQHADREPPGLLDLGQNLFLSAIDTATRGGSSDTDMKALAVMPWSLPQRNGSISR